jgi:hypothetical protein
VHQKEGRAVLRDVNSRHGALFWRGFRTAPDPPPDAHFLTSRSIFCKASKNASENASAENEKKCLSVGEKETVLDPLLAFFSTNLRLTPADQTSRTDPAAFLPPLELHNARCGTQSGLQLQPQFRRPRVARQAQQ